MSQVLPVTAAPRLAPAVAGRLSGTRLMRSVGVRFAMLYAAVFGVSALALAVFLWWATAGLLDRQTDAAIATDAQGLAERWNEGGLPALLGTIQDRLVENVDDNAIYLLVDRSMHAVTGNLEHWPAAVTLNHDWFELPVERAGNRSMARLHIFDLPGGYHLLVGRDVQVRAQLRTLLTDALLWALLVVMILGTGGALLVRSLIHRTLANVSDTAAAISAGDLTRRVPLSGRGDEFDRLAETINDMLDRIARLMDGVREVSNAIAHDLRTPITRARTRLEDAATHAQGADDLRAAIERAQGDLDGVVAVFQALLRIAEIEAGARRSSFAMVEVTDLLRDLCELYSAAAEDEGISLALDCPPSLHLRGDRELIQQAVANLLDNAIKFSPAGKAITLGASHQGSFVRIVVADQGPGIPEADRTRAMERFFRGEMARHTPGSGLGLSLVLAVAQLHGGTLNLLPNHPGLRAELELATQEAPLHGA
jgi:signal transduction histidine kinase